MLNDPRTWEERRKVAEEYISKMKLSIPVLIDGMDNKTDSDYMAWPDRLYVVGMSGRIIYKGGKGPGGFKPLEMVEVLEKPTGIEPASKPTTWGTLKA